MSNVRDKLISSQFFLKAKSKIRELRIKNTEGQKSFDATFAIYYKLLNIVGS